MTETAPRTDTHGPSPAELLDDWRALVAECERSYDWNAYEYHNDLIVRDRVATALEGMDDARRTPYAAEVAEVDARFRALLQPDVQVGPEEDPWWRRGVPRFAGAELARDLKEWFGVEVEVRDEP